MEKPARLDYAALHDGNARFKERYDAAVHHCRGDDAGQRTVSQKSAKTNGQQQKRLESLYNRKVHQHKAYWNHYQLPNAVWDAEERLHLVPLDECACVVKISAMPRPVLAVVAVIVSRRSSRWGFVRTLRLVPVPCYVGGSLTLRKPRESRIA